MLNAIMHRESPDELAIKLRLGDACLSLFTNQGKGRGSIADLHDLLCMQFERELDEHSGVSRNSFVGRYPDMHHEMIGMSEWKIDGKLNLHFIRNWRRLFQQLCGEGADPLEFLETAIAVMRRSYEGETIDKQEQRDSKIYDFVHGLCEAPYDNRLGF